MHAVALIMAISTTPACAQQGILAGVSSKFPDLVKDNTNYWADVIFVPSDGPPDIARSLFSLCQIPKQLSDTGIGPAEIGLVFEPRVDGQVVGARFYKRADDTSSHYANLWDYKTHKLLAHAMYGQETQSGWQEVQFQRPVQVSAGSRYVVSYNTHTGKYAGSPFFFHTDLLNGPLLMPGSPNGVYAPLSARE